MELKKDMETPDLMDDMGDDFEGPRGTGINAAPETSPGSNPPRRPSSSLAARQSS